MYRLLILSLLFIPGCYGNRDPDVECWDNAIGNRTYCRTIEQRADGLVIVPYVYDTFTGGEAFSELERGLQRVADEAHGD